VVLSQILLRRSCRGRGPGLWRGVGGQRGAWVGRRAALVARRAPQRLLLEPEPEGEADARGRRRGQRGAPSPAYALSYALTASANRTDSWC
jgi:hypothetical protein